MKNAKLGVFVLLCALVAGGCAINVGTKRVRPPEISTFASAYVGFQGITPYDGNIIHLGIWNMDSRPGEIISFDLWPVVGVGVGLVGVRAHVLPIDVGAGLIWYQPVPCYVTYPEPATVEINAKTVSP